MNIQFKLNGLSCEGCVKTSEDRISKINGVSTVKVDLDSGSADIEANRDVNLAELNRALEGTGYTAEAN